MSEKVIELDNIQGLSQQQIPLLQQQYGKNIFYIKSSHRLLRLIWDIFKEPMFILLSIACLLYFILGSISEGIMMAIAISIVAAISLYQEMKSSRAIKALKQFTAPKVIVIRDGKENIVLNEELVPEDIVLLEEGMKVPADAIVLQKNDLSVNESIITGESLPVEKQEIEPNNQLYQGTTINSGKCIAKVTATGNSTILGGLGKAVDNYNTPQTLLQIQINRFVKRFALFGLIGFLIILIVNYVQLQQFATSLLFALTLAMSVIPEEIPVAFSSFMALGAYKMSKLGIISHQPQTIENLGNVSVLCFDKTGTLTENKMEIKTIYDYDKNAIINIDRQTSLQDINVLYYAILASEVNPFDAMEKAIWETYQLYTDGQRHKSLKMIQEYPLQGQPPMMTHVYQKENIQIVAAKGASERILKVCKLDEYNRKEIIEHSKSLAIKGYRVIGIASAVHTTADLPTEQDIFSWKFEGLLAFYDPPKKNASTVIKKIYDAKIDIKLLTGDYMETAINIAEQVGISRPLHCLNGEQVMQMEENKLKGAVKDTVVFARMFPEAKVKVIRALQSDGEVVAMTGDGVNDAPALKLSDVGIAMGKKGTEMARQTADLILTDDNLEKMVVAITEGRKIFNNLLKAIRYIISIHIPVILIASIPVIFSWNYPNIFTPIHIIFLELIMAPTCSIFFEKEPIEGNIMLKPPRSKATPLFTFKELTISIIQGLVIAGSVLTLYYFFMRNNCTLAETRNIVFTTLILSNILLTFANRSFTKTIFYTYHYKNSLVPFVIVISTIFLAAIHFIPFIRNLFQLMPISNDEFLLCSGIAFVSVMWFEVYKMQWWRKRVNHNHINS